jgi:predicted DNA-binding transcriptional regulator AlpA
MPVQEICDTLHIGRSTLYRYVQEQPSSLPRTDEQTI